MAINSFFAYLTDTTILATLFLVAHCRISILDNLEEMHLHFNILREAVTWGAVAAESVQSELGW